MNVTSRSKWVGEPDYFFTWWPASEGRWDSRRRSWKASECRVRLLFDQEAGEVLQQCWRRQSDQNPQYWSYHSHLADQVEQLLWSDDAALKHFQTFAHLHLGSLGLKSVFVRNNNSFRRSMQSLILCCVELRIVPQPRCPPSLVFPMLCFCHSWGQTCCTALQGIGRVPTWNITCIKRSSF